MIFRLFVLLSLVCNMPVWAAAGNTSLEQLVPPIPDWIEGQPDTVEASGDWDWLQLDTHEWLKGEVIALYDDTLEFESDKFGVMSIGWSDVIELRSGRLYRIGLDQGKIDLITSLYDHDFGDLIIGRLYINREKAYISGDLGQLARTDEGPGMGSGSRTHDIGYRVAARGQHQFLEFARIFSLRLCE